MVRGRKLYLFDQDEAAMSEGEGVEEPEREQAKLGLAEGGRRVLGKLWRLRRQDCIGAYSVHGDAGGDLDVRTRI